LQELQGIPTLISEQDDEGHHGPQQIETDGSGELSADEYNQAVGDLVNFLVYAAEPMQVERKRLGLWVMLFLSVFFVFAYLLKKEYWRDVH
jgi:ubiquinol-cytochrome c reductase cytochrome c1 subunit